MKRERRRKKKKDEGTEKRREMQRRNAEKQGTMRNGKKGRQIGAVKK